ncbi:Uncharacterised protein [Mycobacteroides abscessus subsp. bolletii]|nr:Uncharacterised protein [Mycobacteroides abscessus subsp. abscessus]SKF88282.1 Uncharacterised protein [Mycobacteroides abscessus subsp. bolletii]SKG33912.1 Uncharacterised protein [Mycobacteroides abscessus subsp. bolletii]SLC84973.1 Uncharacterised protein [Mycobacteroides abscessus subsp. abscessus]
MTQKRMDRKPVNSRQSSSRDRRSHLDSVSRRMLHDIGVGHGIDRGRDEEIRRIWQVAAQQGR